MEITPINELIDLTKTPLGEIHERLWYELFKPLNRHDPTTKRLIMEQLNHVGSLINKNGSLVQIVTKSTQWMMPENDLGPERKKRIYVDVIKFEPREIEKNIPSKTVSRIVREYTPPKKQKRYVSIEKSSGGSIKRGAALKPVGKARRGGTETISGQIIGLLNAGKSQQQIIDAGFNRNTVVPIVWKWKKSFSK
jgi:hypothetical protein